MRCGCLSDVIGLHAVSPQNEMPVANRLHGLIAQAWPDLAQSRRDRIDLLVGVRTPTDVDLLILIDLDQPRPVPPQRRRSGGVSPETLIRHGAIAVEVKQLDVARFRRVGNQLFPMYDEAGTERSVATQARDAALGVSAFARQSGCSPFIYALAWLTEVDEASLAEIEPLVLGRQATWFGMLAAAMQQSGALAQTDSPETARAMRTVRERLLNRRMESRRDRVRVESLSRELASAAAVDAMVQRAGSAQLRLIGRGGSGKTTSLALLAVRLAEQGERVLILTFHRTLRGDIAHLVDGLARRVGLPAGRVHVETMIDFLFSALRALGAEIPMAGDLPDYLALNGALDDVRGMLTGTPASADGDVARLRAEQPARFAWDHVFIDEAQDCSDSERDFLRALYGHRRFVLADGVDQLIRRQVRCDWNAGVPAAERADHRLDTSLRMLRNVATFANGFARALGIDTWRIAPHEELPGGRIIIASGDVLTPGVLRALVRSAADKKADAVDCLICLPPASGDDPRRANLLAAAAAANVPVWDGTVAETRERGIAGADALRLVRYDSCRGLEGWITLALDIDDLAANKRRHPNLHPADPPVDIDVVADRWMLIPLTRAVHTLIITVRDPASRTAELLRQATDDPAMPRVVEWVDAAQLAAILEPNGAIAPALEPSGAQ